MIPQMPQSSIIMEGMEEEADKDLMLLPSSSPVVAVAISGNKNSKHIIRWSLEKFGHEGIISFKLLHIIPRITSVPTPMGNSIPVSQVREDVAAAYRKEMGWQTSEKLVPYKKMFAQRKVQHDVVTLEADDVANAIIEEVTRCSIRKLVIGISSQGFFSRKLNGLSSRISAHAPRYCTVYAISKGKLASIRPPDMETSVSIKDDSSEASSAHSYSSYSSSSLTDSSSSFITSYSHFPSPSPSPSQPLQRFQALSTINQCLLTTKTSPIVANHSRCHSVDIEEPVDCLGSSPNVSYSAQTLSRASSCKSLPTDYKSWVPDEASSSGTFNDYVSCESQADVNFELEKLRIELRHAREMNAISQQETANASLKLEILSKIHHPHLLLLLGACPDKHCLVYEYMENGSLEDRLYRRGNTPAIPWYERYRIAWEIASALVFLHSSKPKPIIHRDLKPANILLDRNLVSKIGDVGLSTVLNSDPLMSTAFKDGGPVGTLCYIDPEYQRTGLISRKSDVYAFGMVILQLLTAKPAVALTHVVETAIEKRSLIKVLDIEAGHWPIEETYELARLGLWCAELQRKDRPNLKEQVLPLLVRLRKVADEARNSASTVPPAIPNHFICPILQDMMNDPCVAADGYTYDRRAIEKWLQENDISPTTKLPLLDKNLIPNQGLLSSIMEWNSRKD
ncbi:U-box domain-containing protein 35-like isoform X6 [Cucurbita maxima]|uniref:RING-type E3 ubiquitin transferase n=1 Tax=Cucurbita maxima TaxID=3661 RepID=A0A6J1K2U9_CUCMA|nr:U-box domain-containing protein 35-like isoform X6 [Cucurbita maxima]